MHLSFYASQGRTVYDVLCFNTLEVRLDLFLFHLYSPFILQM